MAELRVEGLTKAYRGVRVVDDVTFSVPSGRFFALLGPSGSGKTTIMRMISGFVAPDSGRVLVDGEEVTHLSPERRRMGVVFQSYALFPHMSVWHNVAFGLAVRRVARPERARRIRAALDLVHLRGFEDRRPAELSGGQQQRVALARALVVEPRLLLLDEPLSALDARIRAEMRGELRRIQEESGVTAVIVTHDQEEAMELADALLVLDAGRAVQQGTPRAVYTAPRTGEVAAFMGRSQTWAGRLERRPDGTRWLLGPGGLQWPWPYGEDAAGPVRIGVRPESVAVQATAGATDGPEAEVAWIRFEGALTRLGLRAGGQVLESLVLSRDARRFAPGDRVRISVDAEDLHLYPAGPDDAAGRDV